MKIMVCFKIVADYDDVLPGDWEQIEQLDTSYVKKIYGCYEEAALENALRLKDECKALGIEADCIALTAGNGPSALFTALYAAGFDQVIRMGIQNEEFSTRYTAGKVAEVIRQENPDLVITGKQIGANDSGMFPAYLAQILQYSWTTEVTECHMIKSGNDLQGEGMSMGKKVVIQIEEKAETKTEKQIKEQINKKWDQLPYSKECGYRITFERDGRTITIDQKGPVLLSMGNAKASYLRMFSLKARMEARKREVVQVDFEDSPVYELPKWMQSERRESHCQMMEAGNAREQAEWICQWITNRGNCE